jgi:hypothetical protein
MAGRILKELMWHPGKSLKGVTITYVHRGAPGDVVTISSNRITSLEKSFFVIGEKRIPYHRIVEIKKGREILWNKRGQVSEFEK